MSPDPFSDIIGHERVREAFSSMLKNNRLPHAFLFVGPEGVGKETVARCLLRNFLGGALETHSDFLFVERIMDEKVKKMKSHISVDQIREVKEKLALTSFSGKKAVLILDADKMLPPAANALLKTLEEPRGDALIILLATHEAALLTTISSRCQIMRFHPVPTKIIASAMKKYVGTDSEAQRFARISFGSPGLAIRLARDAEYREQFLDSLEEGNQMIESDLPSRLKRIGSILPKDETNKSAAFDQHVSAWEQAMRDQLLASIGCHDLMTVSGTPVASSFPRLWLSALRAVQEARDAVSQNGNPQLCLEHAVIEIPS